MRANVGPGMVRGPRPSAKMNARRVAAALALLTVLGASPVVAEPSPRIAPAPSAAPVAAGLWPTASASLWISNRAAVELPTDFWGVNGGVYYRANANATQVLENSPLSLVIWPSGDLTDSYNMTANRVYGDGNTWYSPPTNERAFIAWCRSVHCHALLGLPAEIDSPSTAAYEVAYTERTLGFFPDYWEIGNEPALWQHFGVPWSQWTASQKQNATPVPFARLVQRYVAAIHGVDPSARIVGLSGLGSGARGETTWIRAVVGLNGANLSAVAIHVYPAGNTNALTGTLSQFYSSLSGKGSLSYRLPRDRAAIRAACSTCADLGLFVTELNSATVAGGTNGGNYATYMSGYPEVPYVAAEIAQGLDANATGLDLYNLQGLYDGSLINGSSVAPRPLATFCTRLLPYLGSRVVATSLSSTAGGLYVAATWNATGSDMRLLLVNTNTTTAASVPLVGTGFPTGAGEVWHWNSRDASGPLTTVWTSAPSDYTILPEAVAVIRGTNATSLTTSVGSVRASAVGSIGPAPPGGALGATPLAIAGVALGAWVAAARPGQRMIRSGSTERFSRDRRSTRYDAPE
jgi:hypothetical protein